MTPSDESNSHGRTYSYVTLPSVRDPHAFIQGLAADAACVTEQKYGRSADANPRCVEAAMRSSPQSPSAAHAFKDEPVHHECHLTVLVNGEASRHVDEFRGTWALRCEDKVANEGNALSLF
jgi:hypothetical protein